MFFNLDSFTSWYMCAQRRDVDIVVCTGPFPNVNMADKYYHGIRDEVSNSTLMAVNNLTPFKKIYMRYKYDRLFNYRLFSICNPINQPSE